MKGETSVTLWATLKGLGAKFSYKSSRYILTFGASLDTSVYKCKLLWLLLGVNSSDFYSHIWAKKLRVRIPLVPVRKKDNKTKTGPRKAADKKSLLKGQTITRHTHRELFARLEF